MIIYEPPAGAENIPLVDFSGAFSSDPAARRAVAWEVHKAGRDTGFFYLTGHGVAAETMAASWNSPASSSGRASRRSWKSA